MKTTDWRWGGSILGLSVRRHGFWYIALFKNQLCFRTSESPRWMLLMWRLHVGWWPKDAQRLDIGWRKQ